ncbi:MULTISPECIES: hypothetical protein [unclassified Bacillus (in: firmicutes)]|uniref:hypothetical protein n=1 Tax=unclassified Bacillus (in: firmicutes) TaxID=185979 RepID=UPI0015970079|nr:MULTISPECIES: hypothetical protein [unclassified Bacillus (in: firmicutes)]
MFTKIPVIYRDERYIMLVQYASGYCEIVKEGNSNYDIKLVHFSELKMKEV